MVYPAGAPSRSWFAHYAQRFDTVELNSTFYRLPAPATVERWAAQAPPGFVYAVKLGQFATHRRKLRLPETWLANHLDRVRRLGPSLGPNLVQLPPAWRRDPARLEAFLALAPRELRWAVELRDRSWLHDEVFAVLARYDAALVLHDLLPVRPPALTARWCYLRFHGPNPEHERYGGRYGGRRLWRVAEQAGAWLAEGRDVYAYFNNDRHGDAVLDAAWLAARLGAGADRTAVTVDGGRTAE
ncbi:MAG: DUF72 domain-containing protein [Acidimicrobiales bacterium]